MSFDFFTVATLAVGLLAGAFIFWVGSILVSRRRDQEEYEYDQEEVRGVSDPFVQGRYQERRGAARRGGNPIGVLITDEEATAEPIHGFVLDLVPDAKEFEKASEVTREVLGDKLVGLSRVSVRTLVRRALTSGERITGAYLTRMKKELIEKEAAGRLEFLESSLAYTETSGLGLARVRSEARMKLSYEIDVDKVFIQATTEIVGGINP